MEQNKTNTTKQTTKDKAIKAADNSYRVAIAARDAYEAASKSALDAYDYDAAIASAQAVYRAELALAMKTILLTI